MSLSSEERPEIVVWRVWTFESRRSEHPRSRFYSVTNTKYPQTKLWLEDTAKDVAKTAFFRFELRSLAFQVLMYGAKSANRYGSKELLAAFKVKMHRVEGNLPEPEITSASFFGKDAKVANYEWKYRADPVQPPPLVPASPDILSSPMFAGPGVIHKQYPHFARHHYPTRESLGLEPIHHYPLPKTPIKWYGNPVTRRTGLPSELPTFSTAGTFGRRTMSRKVRRKRPTY